MVTHSNSSGAGDVCLMLPLAMIVCLELLLVNNKKKLLVCFECDRQNISSFQSPSKLSLGSLAAG